MPGRARFSTQQTNFIGGVLTPRLSAHTDLGRYRVGLEECLNYIVQPQGGLARRSGTRFIRATDGAGVDPTRLVPFIFSEAQSYMLALSDLKAEVFSGNAYIGAGGTFTTRVPESLLSKVQYAQSADVLFLVCGQRMPTAIVRASHSSWTGFDMFATGGGGFYGLKDGPYLTENTTATTITPSATTGAITLTASAALFSDSDQGRLVRLKHGSTWGWCSILSFISPTQVNAQVESTLGGVGAVTTWRLGAFYFTTGAGDVGNFPKAVALFQQRLVLKGTDLEPDTVWMSRTGDYFNFAPTETDGTVNDDNAITVTPASGQVDVISWGRTHKDLLIGSDGGLTSLNAGRDSVAVTPSNVQMRQISSFGAHAAPAMIAGAAVVYIQQRQRKLRSLFYEGSDLSQQREEDLTLLAEHLTSGALTELAYADNPNGIVWCLLATGELLALTFLPDQQVAAWHKHIIGGALAGGIAQVTSIAVIPGSGHDELWMVVKRTINGSAVHYIEKLQPDFDPDVDVLSDAWCVDSGLQYSGAPATTLTGLDHLEGETVQVLGDGVVHASKVVAGGQITLANAVSKAQVGLGFTSRAKTLPVTLGETINDVRMDKKRIHHVTWSVRGLSHLKAGTQVGVQRAILFRDPATYGAGVPMVTTAKRVSWPGQPEISPAIVFSQDAPTPGQILALQAEVVSNAA